MYSQMIFHDKMLRFHFKGFSGEIRGGRVDQGHLALIQVPSYSCQKVPSTRPKAPSCVARAAFWSDPGPLRGVLQE